MKYTPHPYQQKAANHIILNPITVADGAGLFMEMGLGKTVATLTALDFLLATGEVKKPLVIAPLSVAEHTWIDEIAKWDHLQHLNLSKVLGSEKQRKAALKRKADLYITNRENVAWLVAHYGTAFPFDMVIIDELSSFKNPKAQRFKALKTIRPLIKRVVGLTGTPAPNGVIDLWAQLFLLDRGKRLEKNITAFREKYFVKNPYTAYSDYRLKEEADPLIGKGYYEKKITEKISDICISIQAADWLDLPERIDVVRDVHLPEATLAQYKEFEKEQVLRLLEIDKEVTAVNAAALINKLLQFGNGAVYYDDDRNYQEIHNYKIDKLGEEIEAANGSPLLVTYQFRSDLERIKKHLKAFKPVHFHDSNTVLKDWNAGKIPVLLGHAASMGHGLNMQFGGNLITHFGVGWNLELDQQVIARVHRQGQEKSVINSRLLCLETYDRIVYKRLIDKAAGQQSVMDAVKVLINKYK